MLTSGEGKVNRINQMDKTNKSSSLDNALGRLMGWALYIVAVK